MPPPQDLRLPPLKYLIAGTVSFLILTLLSIREHPDKFSSNGGDYGSDVRNARLDPITGAYVPVRKVGIDDEMLVEGSRNRTKANAAFVALARNSDVWGIAESVRQIEDRFNGRGYHYDYVFLNDEPFSEEFKRVTSNIASGVCKYGLVPKEHWEEPPWIDEEKAAKARKEMEEKKVIYGGSKAYRRMCRYESGFFFRHSLLDQYDYYWRLDPSVKFFCDLDYDPFLFMQQNKKKYGWTVSLYEYAETIPTLWDKTKEFIKANPEYLAKPNMMEWISGDGGETYNRCHFWSNFEIGDLNFLRSPAYMKYFEHLDRSGGFSYERWGDAPVHSIAAALFLQPQELHYFEDVGYFHNPFLNCPADAADRCYCNPNDQNNFAAHKNHWYSCSAQMVALQKQFAGR
ncbi:hypothetical protein JCM5350_008215 [Sporobolomyces pararoseus]